MRESFEALYRVLWSKIEKVNSFFFLEKGLFFVSKQLSMLISSHL